MLLLIVINWIQVNMSFLGLLLFIELLLQSKLLFTESRAYYFKNESILDSFKIKPNTIIKTEESFASGAKYLNGTEMSSNRDCLEWCWQYINCNLAVYEEKVWLSLLISINQWLMLFYFLFAIQNQGTCYLFNCGPIHQMNCKFDDHDHFTSSFLQVNRNLIDPLKWNDHLKHENDLLKLRKLSPSQPPPLVNSKPSVTTTSSVISESNEVTTSNAQEKTGTCPPILW